MKEAFYFSHDSNARNDKKILKMLAQYGWQGYGYYWAIIEILRDEPDYKLANEDIDTIAMQLRTDISEIQAFIDFCTNKAKLFISDGGYFWSESLCRRMEVREEIIEKRREAGKISGEKKNQKKEELAEIYKINFDRNKCSTNVEQMLNTCETNVQQGKERKGKEIKGKEIVAVDKKNFSENQQQQKTEFLEILKGVENYPFDEKKDANLYDSLVRSFKDIDILAEVSKWAVYKLDNPVQKDDSPRTQINQWCFNQRKYNQKEMLKGNKGNYLPPEREEPPEPVKLIHGVREKDWLKMKDYEQKNHIERLKQAKAEEEERKRQDQLELEEFLRNYDKTHGAEIDGVPA